MIELCDDGHDQVAYDGGVFCPVCRVQEENDQLVNEKSDLEVDVEELTSKVNHLEGD